MDGQQAEHPVVVLAQVRLALLRRSSRRASGVIAKNAFWPLSSGPGEIEHRAAEGAQEDRRPADVERLVGEADEVVFRGRTPRSARSPRGRSRAARPAPGARGDGVEDAADDGRLVVAGTVVAGRQAGQSSRASRTSSARTASNSRSAAARIRSGVSVSERIVWRILRAKSSAPRRPSPSLAGRTTSRRCALEGGERGLGGVAAASRRGRSAATPGPSPAADRRSQASSISSSTPGQLLERGLGLEPPDRATGAGPDERRPRPRRGPRGMVSSRPATLARRSASGANSRASSGNRPSPEQVDPVERVPGVLAQLRLARTARPRARR